MTELEKKIAAKIPGEDTGIEIKHTFCDLCAPLCHCGIDAYVKDGAVIKIEGTEGHPMNNGVLCTKGANNRAYIYRPDRVRTPLKRVGPKGSGEFEPISWDEAYDIVAENLNRVKEQYGPNAVTFYSGHCKWYRFLLQRFAHVFGSVNFGTESSTCFMSSRLAWLILTGRFARPDFPNAKLYLAWASSTHYARFNVANNLDDLHRRGGITIAVDPRITPGTQRNADLHLRVNPGTDGLLANAIAGEIIRNDWQDKEYIEKYVHGFEPYAEHVLSIDIQEASRIAGISVEDIHKAADMIAHIKPACCENNPTSLIHQPNGFQTARAVFSLMIITGNYNSFGGNTPMDFTFCEQGAGFETHEEEFALERMPGSWADAIGGKRFPVWSSLITQQQCCDMSRQILEGTPYPVRAMLACGMNNRVFPDTNRTNEALKALDFFVDIDLFMTDGAKLADVVLPACSSFEREEFKVYPGGWAGYYLPAIQPLYESKSDGQILQELAIRMDLDDEWLKAGYRASVEHILEGSDLHVDEMIAAGKLVRAPHMIPPKPFGYVESGCLTPSGKIELYSEVIASIGREDLNPLPVWEEPPLRPSEEYPFLLQTGTRVPNNIHSKLHSVPWARSLRPYPMLDMNDRDAERLGLEPGDDVELYNMNGCIRVKVNPTAALMPGRIIMPHGYPEADSSTLLSGELLDPYSGFPGFKASVCNIRKVEGGTD